MMMLLKEIVVQELHLLILMDLLLVQILLLMEIKIKY